MTPAAYGLIAALLGLLVADRYFSQRALASLEASRNARIGELERQIDSLHRRGLTVEPAPPPDTKVVGPALPSAIRNLLDGVEDEEARAEYEAWATERLAAGDDEAKVAAGLFA